MGHDDEVDAANAESRAAGAPPEEARRGSDDPVGQAEAILEDSEERTADRNAAPSTLVEHRRSDEVAVDPEE
jgi:hypothetical protein